MPSLTVYIDDTALQALEDVARVTGRSTTDLASAAVEEAAMAARNGTRYPGPRQGHLPLTSMSRYPRMDSEYPRMDSERMAEREPLNDPRHG